MIEALRGIDRLTWFNRISGGYLLLMVPLYWNYEAYDSTLWEKFLVAHIVVIRMGIGWLLSALSNRENGGRFALDTPILLYLGLVALSWMWAINPLKSGMEVIRVLLAATVYFAVSRTYTSESRDTWLCGSSAALGIVSLVGVIQYLGIGFLDWRSAGLPNSTFYYRNYAAMYVAIALPLAFGSLVLTRNDTTRLLHAASATLGVIFLIYTRTRGAWLGIIFAVVGVILALRVARDESSAYGAWFTGLVRQQRTLWVAGLVIVAALLMPPAEKGELDTLPAYKSSAAGAFVSILAGQGSGRTGTWLQSLQMIADHPLLGSGIGNWDASYLQYAGPILHQDGGLFARPHNDYLWTVTELGLSGLILFIWMPVGGLWLVWCRMRQSNNGSELILLTSLCAGLIAISVHAFFSFPRERMAATVIPFLYLGWISAVTRDSRSRPVVKVLQLARPAVMAVLCVLTLSTTIQVTRAYRAYFWADAYRTFDRFEQALAAISSAIELGVVDYRFYELKALIHHRMGDPEAALDASERLLKYHPHNPWSFHKVGLFHLELGNYADARDAFASGVQYAPGVGRIRRDLGRAYDGLGQPDSALASYEMALKAIPSDALLRTRLASSMADLEDFEAAKEHITVAAERLKLTRAHADVTVVGDVAMKSKAYDAAVLAYGRAAALVPENPVYQVNQVNALEAAGEIESAVAVLKSLLESAEPSDQEAIQKRIARMEQAEAGG
ncbi:MAG TPA: hypothetical protein DHW45_01980 [Candidatus Latescibacteria bacterium]|nr:hypothetical protein [Candidatus Latescibacterota bacterium]